MPRFVVHYFQNKSLEFHLGMALTLGTFFRCLTAYFAYGPMAMDDYVDGIMPAIKWASGEWPLLSEGRSYLLVWYLGGLLRLGALFGIEASAASQIRFVDGAVGILSLATIIGGYLYVKAREPKAFGPLFLYLLAIFFIMPFGSTRTFGETVSMSWVMLGVGLGEWGRRRGSHPLFFLAVLCLGASVLFRFQNGLLFLAYLAWLVWERQWRWLLTALAAGLVILAAQLGVDRLSGYTPFQTLLRYLDRNEGGAASYGVQPWYTHVAVLLGCTLFPFSLVFADRIGRVVKQHAGVVFYFLVFVVGHSVIPHKEERFMFPVIPLLLLLLAAVWEEKRDTRVARLLYFPAFVFFNTLLLSVITFSNSQAGNIEPIVKAQEKYDRAIFVETNTEMKMWVFLRKPFTHLRIGVEALTPAKVDELFTTYPQEKVIVLVAAQEVDNPTPLAALDGTESSTAICERVTSVSSLPDRLIFRVNPKRNWGRRPTFSVTCTRSAAF